MTSFGYRGLTCWFEGLDKGREDWKGLEKDDKEKGLEKDDKEITKRSEDGGNWQKLVKEKYRRKYTQELRNCARGVTEVYTSYKAGERACGLKTIVYDKGWSSVYVRVHSMKSEIIHSTCALSVGLVRVCVWSIIIQLSNGSSTV